MCQTVIIFPNIYFSQKELRNFGLGISWIKMSAKLF